jgi:hypothetical protein
VVCQCKTLKWAAGTGIGEWEILFKGLLWVATSCTCLLCIVLLHVKALGYYTGAVCWTSIVWAEICSCEICTSQCCAHGVFHYFGIQVEQLLVFFNTCYLLKCFSSGFDLLGCLAEVWLCSFSFTEQSWCFCTVVFGLGGVLEFSLLQSWFRLSPADSVVSSRARIFSVRATGRGPAKFG